MKADSKLICIGKRYKGKCIKNSNESLFQKVIKDNLNRSTKQRTHSRREFKTRIKRYNSAVECKNFYNAIIKLCILK